MGRSASLTEPRQTLDVERYCEQREEVGFFEVEDEGRVRAVRCVRPWRIVTQLCPPEVRPTSNARLLWRSQFYAEVDGSVRDVPEAAMMGGLVQGVRFFTHNLRSPLRVRRFALGSTATLRMTSGQERLLQIRFTDGSTGERAAVGFEQEVDGILFQVRIPDDLCRRVSTGPGLRACRVAFFRDQVQADPTLRQHTQENPFRLEWLAQVFLAVLLARSLARGYDLRRAAEDPDPRLDARRRGGAERDLPGRRPARRGGRRGGPETTASEAPPSAAGCI